MKFLCGQEVTVKPTRWTFKMGGGVLVSRKQIPLKLAWAISIHKSQVNYSMASRSENGLLVCVGFGSFPQYSESFLNPLAPDL